MHKGVEMEVTFIKENEDGSADYQLTNMSDREQAYLIQKGFIKMLEEFIEREEAEGKLPALFKEKVGGTD
jgi:hypothetical protein